MKKKQLNNQLKRKSIFQIYLIITLSSFLIAICIQYFVIPSGIYSPGLGGIVNGITYVMFAAGMDINETTMFWSIYIILNIPIIIFMWIMFGEDFFIRTMFYLVINIGAGFLFSLTPGLKDIYIIPEIDVNELPDGVENLYFAINILIISFLSLLGGIIYGIGIGMTFSVGGSTAGADPISRFLARNRGMNIAHILFFISIIISLFFTTILWFMSGDLTFITFIEDIILSPEIIGTLIFAFSYSFIASKIYSTTKMKKITVTSKKADEISDHFNKINYHRAHSITEMKGGFSKDTYYSIQMVLNSEELQDVAEDIANIDQNAFIVIDEVSKIYDIHDWRAITKVDIKDKKKKNIHKKINNYKKDDKL